MKADILDDWFDMLQTPPCFAKLERHVVRDWTEHQPDPARPERLRGVEALVLFRVRTAIGDTVAASRHAFFATAEASRSISDTVLK